MRRTRLYRVCLALTLAFAPELAVADDFATPLFGLATAPNGDLLVADAPNGVVLFHDGEATLDIEFPGITDISPIGRSSFWATRNGTDPLANSGQALYRLSHSRSRKIANLFRFEKMKNPDGHPEPESNPFDVQSLGGRSALVVDAAANDLLQVDNQGGIEVLAVFPDEEVSTNNIKSLFGCPAGPPDICNLPSMLPAQPVPTSVAIGPDGNYYVGELKGFPAPTGASKIWRVLPFADWAECGGETGECQLVFDGGFTSIIDLAFGPDGMLYVVELDEASWFAVEVLQAPTTGTINKCDVEEATCEVVAHLPIPTAITFGKRGHLWATQNALIPGVATVVKVP